jgi:hypothetical protein
LLGFNWRIFGRMEYLLVKNAPVKKDWAKIQMQKNQKRKKIP